MEVMKEEAYQAQHLRGHREEGKQGRGRCKNELVRLGKNRNSED